MRLHKNYRSFESSQFRVVSGTSDYQVGTAITITHIALSPNVFGALFKVEGWRYYFRTLNKTLSVSFLIVCPQVTLQMPIAGTMVKVFKATPALDERGFSTMASSFTQYVLSAWN